MPGIGLNSLFSTNTSYPGLAITHYQGIASFESTGKGLTMDLLSKSVHLDHLEPVESFGDQFAFVMCLKLKGNLYSVGVDNAGTTNDSLTRGCRGQVTDLNKRAHRAFASLKQR